MEVQDLYCATRTVYHQYPPGYSVIGGLTKMILVAWIISSIDKESVEEHTLVSSLPRSCPFPPSLLLFQHSPFYHISLVAPAGKVIAYNLGSLGLIIRLTAANLRVCFALPLTISFYISHLTGIRSAACSL